MPFIILLLLCHYSVFPKFKTLSTHHRVVGTILSFEPLGPSMQPWTKYALTRGLVITLAGLIFHLVSKLCTLEDDRSAIVILPVS